MGKNNYYPLVQCNIRFIFNLIFKEGDREPYNSVWSHTYYVAKDDLRLIIEEEIMNSSKTNDIQQNGLDKEQKQLHNIYIISYFKSS